MDFFLNNKRKQYIYINGVTWSSNFSESVQRATLSQVNLFQRNKSSFIATHLPLTLVWLNIRIWTIVNNHFNSLTFIALFYLHALKCWFRWILLIVFIIMLHEEKNTVTSYYGLMKIRLKNKHNIYNNITTMNRFLVEIITIINIIIAADYVRKKNYVSWNITKKVN